MSADNRVNNDDEAMNEQPGTAADGRPRWWRRSPVTGVLVALVLGFATVWVSASIESPDAAPRSTLRYMVLLPIALLLPAIAVGGAFVTWQAFAAARGKLRLVLAPAAAVALTLNLVAVGLFLRWLARVFIA